MCCLPDINHLFVYRNVVQGMGYPLIPMISGFAEMILRIPAIILLLPHMEFRATAYAEIIAWVGALALNVIAYIIYFQKRIHHN